MFGTTDGWVYIIPRINSNLCLDIQGGHAGNGVNAWLWDRTTNNNGYGQMFRFVRMLDDGYYSISSYDNEGFVLDVVASSKADGANVTLWSKTLTPNQIFHVYQVSGHAYKIVSANSNKALDVVAGGKTNGTNVTQWSVYSTNNQLWDAEIDAYGKISFVSRVNGLCLDVQGGHAGKSVNIQVWEKTSNNSGRGQQFILDRMIWTFDEKQAALSSFATSRSISAFGNYSISSSAAQSLQAAVNRIRSAGYDVGFVMMDLTTGQGVSYNADTSFYSASTIKGPYVASVVYYNPWALNSWSSTINAILVNSSNEGYASIRAAFGSSPFYNWCVTSGVRTSLSQGNYTRYSARELAKLWTTNYNYFNNGGAALANRFHNAYGSATHMALGSKYVAESKGGWIADGEPYNATCDGAIVHSSNGDYVLAIMSNVPARQSMLTPLVNALDQAHNDMRSQI